MILILFEIIIVGFKFESVSKLSKKMIEANRS